MIAVVTRKDIAAKAGVSVSVVSRALNNSGYVEAEKKKKILQIAKELGYSPNPVAMSLASRRTKQILFYCKDLRNAFNIEAYEGMFRAAQKQDYMVVVNGDIDFHRIKDLMVDGLIFPNEIMTQQYLRKIGKNYYLPVVSMGFGNVISGEFQKSVPIVECDLWRGTEQIFQYLWMRGHHRIAMVTPYWWNQEESRIIAWKQLTKEEFGERQREYYLGMSCMDFPGDSRITVFPEERVFMNEEIPDSFFEKGEVSAEIFREKNLDATAVICFNDEMAMGFCKKMKMLGCRIPEDLSVVSYDGVYSGRYAIQKLTTLSLNAQMLGKKCVEVLLDKIIGNKIKNVTHIPLKLIEGETVRTLRE